MNEEKADIIRRIETILSAVDMKLLYALERIIRTYINAANRSK